MGRERKREERVSSVPIEENESRRNPKQEVRWGMQEEEEDSSWQFVLLKSMEDESCFCFRPFWALEKQTARLVELLLTLPLTTTPPYITAACILIN